MTPETITFKPIRVGRCTNCREETAVMKVYPIYDTMHEYEFVCEKCAREFNKEIGHKLFIFPSDYRKRSIKRNMEKKRTFKVHVPFIEKDFIVEDWTDDMAVDRVLDTLLTEREQMILSSHTLIMCDCEEVDPKTLN